MPYGHRAMRWYPFPVTADLLSNDYQASSRSPTADLGAE